MSQPNHYKWLIVVEGETDVNTYGSLLVGYGVKKNVFSLFAARGKGNVCNSTTWGNAKSICKPQNNLLATLIQDIGRKDFSGVILLIDSDSDNNKVCDTYKRTPSLLYVNEKQVSQNKGVYWHLDDLNGANKIPIYGISVPVGAAGCLETDLLASYSFPVEGQTEYDVFVDIIKKSTSRWQIPPNKNDKEWWEENSKAKFDKFIYSALSHGFYVSRRTPALPVEPDVIKNIKSVINTQ
jgi:hypothetical protein